MNINKPSIIIFRWKCTYEHECTYECMSICIVDYENVHVWVCVFCCCLLKLFYKLQHSESRSKMFNNLEIGHTEFECVFNCNQTLQLCPFLMYYCLFSMLWRYCWAKKNYIFFEWTNDINLQRHCVCHLNWKVVKFAPKNYRHEAKMFYTI